MQTTHLLLDAVVQQGTIWAIQVQVSALGEGDSCSVSVGVCVDGEGSMPDPST